MVAQKIEQYRQLYGKAPAPKWLSVAAKITLQEAEKALGQGDLFAEPEPVKPAKVVMLEPPTQAPNITPEASHIVEQAPNITAQKKHIGIFDRLVLALAGVLQHVAFFVVTAADFVLECLFYSTFAPNDWSKIALASWGIVIVGAKLWAWSTNRIPLAVFCAALSVIGAVGIFNASMEAQAIVAKAQNESRIEDPRLSIQRQIKALEANIQAMTEQRELLADGTNPAQVKDYNARIDAANAQLPRLRAELEGMAGEVKSVEIMLDAWSIFGQVAGKLGIDARAFAFGFILAVSILLQWIIAATTPKKSA